MKNTKRSAFTIVELVIVIAVIAILSAVLIPTFGAIIKDANIAADQAAASTLTSELHVYLKGNTIDSETELMAALNDEKLGFDEKKLTPKAAAHGVHFWFDMDNQMILAKTAKEIEDLVKEKNTESAYVEHTGVQLINDAQPAAAPTSLNINFRSLLGGNFFIIDKGGSAFVNALNTIAEFSGTSHADLVADVNGVFVDVVVDDQNFVDKFKAALASTVIITENVVLQPATATNVYFDPGIRFVNDHGTISSITAGTVDLPDTVIGVAPGALVFGSADVVLNTACKDASDVEFVFANASTNATIKTAADSYKIAQADGTVTIEESEGKLANRLVLVSDIVDGKAANTVPNITLSNKLTCNDFSIYAEAGNPGDDTIIYNIAGETPTLYVSYNEYVKGGKEITLSLLADDGETVIDGANSSIKWNFGGDNLYKSSITDSTTVTASARNVNGEEKTHSLNIVVVKPTGATVNIGDKAINIGSGSVQTPSFEWGYDGTNGTRAISFDITNYSHAFAHGTSNLSVTVDSDAFTYNDETKEITLKTKGGNGDDAINLAKTGVVNITLSIDGVLETTVNVTLHDYTNAKLVSNYNHSNEDPNRPYYLGNGGITLGHILKLKNANDLPYDSKVSVEVLFGDANPTYIKVDNLSEEDGWAVAYDHSFEITDDDNDAWKDVKINFTSGPDNTPIRIKITPTGAGKDDHTIAINLIYVDGTNVLTADGLFDAAEAGGNVVMMSNITIAQGVTAENYYLDFETDETLYGNGFVLSAKTFIASTSNNGTGTKYAYSYNRTCSNSGLHRFGHGSYIGCTFEWKATSSGVTNYLTDRHLISLNGATVDNIYLDGPVYAEMQYDMYYTTGRDGNDKRTLASYADSPFFVSGIKTEGASNINNSYVSGFRSPVSARGGDSAHLYIDNSTIRGGNYCNIDLMDGDLTMSNVITVQDQNGQKATVDKDGNAITSTDISVAGAGIMLGTNAINSKIYINNYFYQYNWIARGNEAIMPVIDGMNVSEIFGMIFDGIQVVIQLKLTRLLQHTHLISGSNEQYVNAGIIFAQIGKTSDVSDYPRGLDAAFISAANIIDNRTDINGNKIEDAKLKYTRTDMERFSYLGTESYNLNLGNTNINANMILGKDGKVVLFSRVDGRTWGNLGSSVTPHDTDITLTNSDIIYSGYYDGDGSYAAWYNASANDLNK